MNFVRHVPIGSAATRLTVRNLASIDSSGMWEYIDAGPQRGSGTLSGLESQLTAVMLTTISQPGFATVAPGVGELQTRQYNVQHLRLAQSVASILLGGRPAGLSRPASAHSNSPAVDLTDEKTPW